MNETQALARAQTLAYLFIAELLLAKPRSIKELTEKKS
jgi:hypothetical protein